MSKMLTLTLAAAFAATFAWASLGRAQDTPKPKDDAVEKLLEKLEAPKPPDTAKTEPAADDKKPNKAEAPAPKAEKEKEKAPAGAAPAAKGKGQVDTKDEAIDDLLGKLGETRDVPSKDDRPGTPGGKPGGGPSPPKPDSDRSKAHEPTGQAKDLDEHLEELTGRRKKKKGEQDGEGSGPLSEVIKKMREVERRLDKTDTGEQTRQEQGQIVKKLDQIIKELSAPRASPKASARSSSRSSRASNRASNKASNKAPMRAGLRTRSRPSTTRRSSSPTARMSGATSPTRFASSSITSRRKNPSPPRSR